MKISIVIPAYNEAACIGKLVTYLYNHYPSNNLIEEIIVADGQSTDNTCAEAQKAGAVTIISKKKGRAAQMNAGANVATGDILYFLHADSYPPADFADAILNAIQQGYKSGCYQLRFDHSHWFLDLNCWFTRFDINQIRFGDQSLFVEKAVFIEIGGFREDMEVMEDQEIIYRIKPRCKFKVLDGAVITSARKYLDNGIYRTQGIFFIIWSMYKLGYSQEAMVKTYRKLIRQDKI
jgi:rSAM/selenodomain-associated transferase 2